MQIVKCGVYLGTMHFSCNSDFLTQISFFYFVLILLAQKCCWNWHFITLTILYMLAVQRKRSNINCTDKACDNTQIKTFSFSVGSFQLNSAVTGFRLSYRDRKLFPYQQFIHCTLKSVCRFPAFKPTKLDLVSTTVFIAVSTEQTGRWMDWLRCQPCFCTLIIYLKLFSKLNERALSTSYQRTPQTTHEMCYWSDWEGWNLWPFSKAFF